MRKLIIVMLVLVLCISMATVFCACDSDEVYENIYKQEDYSESNSKQEESEETIYNLNDVAGFDDGVLFDITSVKVSQSVEGVFHPIVTENKFIIIKMKVINNSKETYNAYTDTVWLDYNGTKIKQADDIYLINDYFGAISLSATLSKEYVLLFEINKDISLDDVVLRISNNDYWNEKTIGIRLV